MKWGDVCMEDQCCREVSWFIQNKSRPTFPNSYSATQTAIIIIMIIVITVPQAPNMWRVSMESYANVVVNKDRQNKRWTNKQTWNPIYWCYLLRAGWRKLLFVSMCVVGVKESHSIYVYHLFTSHFAKSLSTRLPMLGLRKCFGV